jgi:hypothetical protein
MSDDRQSPRRPARGGIGSLTTIVLVFGFASIVGLAILLGAFFVAIGVIALAVPAALIAKLAKARRDRRDAGG